MSTAMQQLGELLTRPEPIEVPETGLHHGIPAVRYHQWAGASQSRLKTMRDKSPAHVRYEMEHPSEPTPALVLGAAVHTAVLEPELFGELYVRAPQGDRRTKAVKKAWADLEREHPGATILSAADYETCMAIRAAVAEHPVASLMIGGEKEASAVWTDEASGVLCRGRFDVIDTELRAITDLKTTKDASPFRFPKTVYDYGYHIQAAHYIRGAQALGLDIDSFGIIAVEKEPPYAVAVYQLQPAAIYDGGRELDALLKQWAECERTGVWPSYSTDVVQIDLPDYAPKQINRRLGEE